ncbi:hypothetical protein [Mesonia oceanica]|uniref:Uncharacterized protein n=1 Tax=Mesonia oceanica TaxID=2687242 RepID=A0AC61YDK0_9FLAO|nr:hypothetical protein [Mesonia oceanica]MBJ98834.1 hypothetical protein [Flavobacteriaceae bacterium]VVV02599.1 hypothetical protein FVB9532_03906 [Mesonia oceanica]
MTKEKHLYRILFLTSIFLLLINDFYLKYEYHNYLTGKLSDFAGLFAFPYFFSCLFPKRIRPIYILTGILFMFWKSEFSQPIFDFAHSYGIGIDRTVDYTDLMSLFILPISYKYWKLDFRQIIQPNKIWKPSIIGICVFAFIATSVASDFGEINLKANYNTDLNTTLEKARETKLFFVSLKNDRYLSKLTIPEKRAEINVLLLIKKNENGLLNIRLDSILDYEVKGSGNFFGGGVDQDDIDYVKNMNTYDFEKLFAEQKIEPLKNK